jgi:hypothetical protein
MSGALRSQISAIIEAERRTLLADNAALQGQLESSRRRERELAAQLTAAAVQFRRSPATGGGEGVGRRRADG